MARPAKFDRDAAIEIAMNEFWRSGYEANSAKALSERLGITRSSFYNAFGSREALFKEALALYFSHAPDRALVAGAPEKSVKYLFTKTLCAACQARASDPEGRGCLGANSIAELCGADSELGVFLKEAVTGRRAAIQALLDLAIERGEIDQATDTHALALAVQNLFIGMNTLSKVERSEENLWQAARLTLAGLGLLDE